MPGGDACPAEIDGADAQRRTLIRGAALVGLVGVAGLPLSACGDGGVDSAAQLVEPPTAEGTPTSAPARARPTESAPRPTATPTGEPRTAGRKQPAPAPDGASAGPTAPAEPASTPTEKAAPDTSTKAAVPAVRKPKGAPIAGIEQISVGSGTLFESDDLIVTQPVAGEFRGFSPICTHEGCVVDVFERTEMICTCHGSTYRIADGRVVSGPAPKPLPRRSIVVADGKIYRI